MAHLQKGPFIPAKAAQLKLLVCYSFSKLLTLKKLNK